MIEPSPTESDRFGLAIGRAGLSDGGGELDALIGATEGGTFDLVIVRYPADLVGVFHRLASIPGYQAIFADTLLYFEWIDDASSLGEPLAIGRREDMDEEAVSALVEEIFADYTNHYAANPMLDARLVGAGYGEWAASVARHSANRVVVMRAGDVVESLAVIDQTDGWNVTLAGVRPKARGKGAYGRLVTAVMQTARAAGQASVRISTQSHNTQVMRVWERLGWRVTSAFVTVHLQRDRLAP